MNQRKFWQQAIAEIAFSQGWIGKKKKVRITLMTFNEYDNIL